MATLPACALSVSATVRLLEASAMVVLTFESCPDAWSSQNVTGISGMVGGSEGRGTAPTPVPAIDSAWASQVATLAPATVTVTTSWSRPSSCWTPPDVIFTPGSLRSGASIADGSNEGIAEGTGAADGTNDPAADRGSEYHVVPIGLTWA